MERTLTQEINDNFKDFEDIYKRNFGFLKKMCVYCIGYTNEDVYEIALFCYFVHNFQSMIDNKVLTQKEIDNRFRYLFRREVGKDNSYTADIRTNNDLHRVIDRFNKIAAQEIDDTDIEDYIIDKIMYERLLTVMKKDELDFCIMYLNKGHKHASKIYNITEVACRKRYQRILDKAKKRVNELSP